MWYYRYLSIFLSRFVLILQTRHNVWNIVDGIAKVSIQFGIVANRWYGFGQHHQRSHRTQNTVQQNRQSAGNIDLTLKENNINKHMLRHKYYKNIFTSCSLSRSPIWFKFSPSSCKCAAASSDKVLNLTFSYGLVDWTFLIVGNPLVMVPLLTVLLAANFEAVSFSFSLCSSWVWSTARRALRRQLYFSLFGTSAQSVAKRWA